MKRRILFIPSTINGGVYYYRCYTPLMLLSEKLKDEFEIEINNTFKFTDLEKDEIGKNYSIVWVHNGLYMTDIQDEFWKMIIYCKKNYGTKFILDLDDYWEYHKLHPAYDACMFNAFPDKMMINFKLFDYITTTTEYFKSIISENFPESKIFVFPNAISLKDSQFSITGKTKSSKLRLGITGGSSHTEDIKQLLEFPKYLTSKQLEQIELVFCGFDTSGERIEIDENGKIISKTKIDPKDNWWFKTENKFKTMLGDNYRRVETKDIMKGEFGKIYNDIDVILVPLDNNKFNRCKSELKFIEAGFTNTAIVCSNVIPYNNFGVNGEDCLMPKEPNPKEWARVIKKILREPELLERITLYNRIKVIGFRNLENITKDRIEFFRSI